MANFRGIFCNRTLNMRSIRAIGYDMDYTLIQYQVEKWERTAYGYLKEAFVREGWPVQDFQFDPNMVCRGLIVDRELGNILKCNRFGLVTRSFHGTKVLEYEKQREIYSGLTVDLSDKRWVFLNTLFSLSEGCMYAQLVDLLDERKIEKVMGYGELYNLVRHLIDTAHMEGKLKTEIISNPDEFVELDPEVPLALLDQKHAGKKLMLITNSEWTYTVPMMSYTFDRFLPKGMTWRDLFDVTIIGARKPAFFIDSNPFFEVINDQGHLNPMTKSIEMGGTYLGGSAAQLEKAMGLSGDEILYVGDHMFGDVHVSKNQLHWRTALVLRELESDLAAEAQFKDNEKLISSYMHQKEVLEAEQSQIRIELQRRRVGYGPASNGKKEDLLQKRSTELRSELEALDQKIAPLARAAAQLNNPTWGLLMRAGADKSHLARQVERFADIYTSRVSNFLFATPFVYLRGVRGNLPHDQ